MRTFRSHRPTVRTPGFHPGNRGSIPRGIAKIMSPKQRFGQLYFCRLRGESKRGAREARGTEWSGSADGVATAEKQGAKRLCFSRRVTDSPWDRKNNEPKATLWAINIYFRKLPLMLYCISTSAFNQQIMQDERNQKTE